MAESGLPELYGRLKALAKEDLASEAVTDLLVLISKKGHDFLLSEGETVALESRVPEKRYISYRYGGRLSRPINQDLFLFDPKELEDHLAVFAKAEWAHLGSHEATRTLYTLAMIFCAANDTTKTGDKKTPATYFEFLIGHVLAVYLGVLPTKAIKVLAKGLKGGSLPTDYIFDLGPDKDKFHVPIKLSTRERVIQVWAHQRIVNGIYGQGQFKGIPVVMAETKLDTRTHEVVEICLPDQWRVYQRFIAQLTRIYYLDIPEKYAALTTEYPKIEVKSLGHFFFEADAL